MAEIGIPYTIVTPRGNISLNPASGGDGYYLTDVSGLDGSVVRSAVEVMPQRDGAILFDFYGSSRTITLEGYIRATSLSTRRQLEDDLRSRLDSILRSDGELRFTPTGAAERSLRRVRLLEQVLVRGTGPVKTWQLQLVSDGRPAESTTEQSLSSDTPSAKAGDLTLPVSLPLELGDPAGSSDLTVTNAGNVVAYPTFRVHGPVTSPKVHNDTTGTVISLVLLELQAGEYAEIDTFAEEVTLSGDRNTALTGTLDPTVSDFAGLAPGTNTLRLTCSRASSPAKLEVRWRDSYG